MRYFCIILCFLLLSCTPKENKILSNEEKNTEEIIDSKNFNPEIIEKANTTDGFGNELIRLKQDLRDQDKIINDIKNYYGLIRNDGTIIINRSLYYPNVSNTKIMYYNHISRNYDNYLVDLSEFTISLENNQSIKARIFSPYINSEHNDIYFSSNNNYSATKGYYEFGNAINALKNNPLKKIVNKSNIEITSFSENNDEGYHKYLKLGPVSKNYDWVIDTYEYFLIDIYSKESTEEMEIYINEIIEKINF
jgi:hypothetical protein